MQYLQQTLKVATFFGYYSRRVFLGPFSASKSAIHTYIRRTHVGKSQNPLYFSPIAGQWYLRRLYFQASIPSQKYSSVLTQAIDENIDRIVRYSSRWLTSILLEFPINSRRQGSLAKNPVLLLNEGSKTFPKDEVTAESDPRGPFLFTHSGSSRQNFSQRHSGTLKVDCLACSREIIALPAAK